jgi:hypothetical protein
MLQRWLCTQRTPCHGKDRLRHYTEAALHPMSHNLFRPRTRDPAPHPVFPFRDSPKVFPLTSQTPSRFIRYPDHGSLQQRRPQRAP